MSVGAGSIKRAAASAAKDTKLAANEVAEGKTQSAEPAGKTVKARNSSKKGENTAAAKQEKKPSVTKKEKAKDTALLPKHSGGYEAYGIGQQLPIYLL